MHSGKKTIRNDHTIPCANKNPLLIGTIKTLLTETMYNLCNEHNEQTIGL